MLFQAECDELAHRAEALQEENANLRSEVNRIRSEYEQLLSENASLKVILKYFFPYYFLLSPVYIKLSELFTVNNP